MQDNVIQRFIGIQGHTVRAIHFLDDKGCQTEDENKVTELIIELGRLAGTMFRCSCGRDFTRYYDVRETLVRDLPWGPWQNVYLLVPRFRVNCPVCGVATEELEWIPRRCHYTSRLAQAVAFACREVRSISAIAEAFGLSWKTVKQIDKATLEARLNPPRFDNVRHLAVDEFSIKRKHTYGTILLDIDNNRVLWVCRTREAEAVMDVFRNVFGPRVCAGIEAVSMDWWPAYEKAVSEAMPHAEVVWDFFHIIKKYNSEVLDRVRLDEARNCQSEAELRAMKKTKFLLLKNRSNLTAEEPARLKELLAINRRLFVVYILRDALKKLWSYKYPQRAKEWFAGWYRRAIGSRIPALKRFAQKLKKRLHGILAHCRHPIHTGVLEGINNKVKVIKRVAYGFRDFDYFFLKIRAHYNEVTPL